MGQMLDEVELPPVESGKVPLVEAKEVPLVEAKERWNTTLHRRRPVHLVAVKTRSELDRVP